MIEKKVTKMLNEERKRKILELTNLKGSISINDLMKELGASESTVRRDLIDMDSECSSGIKEQMIDRGFDDYLSKPIDVDELQHVLVRFLGCKG